MMCIFLVQALSTSALSRTGVYCKQRVAHARRVHGRQCLQNQMSRQETFRLGNPKYATNASFNKTRIQKKHVTMWYFFIFLASNCDTCA